MRKRSDRELLAGCLLQSQTSVLTNPRTSLPLVNAR
jgi:hypothetical protein